jgi:hypothetical protein
VRGFCYRYPKEDDRMRREDEVAQLQLEVARLKAAVAQERTHRERLQELDDEVIRNALAEIRRLRAALEARGSQEPEEA